MIQTPKRIDQWLKALVAAVISGFSNSALAAIGIGAANGMGMQVEPLHWKQVIDIGLSGAFIGVLLYLKKSPVPDDVDSTGQTDFVQKPQDPKP